MIADNIFGNQGWNLMFRCCTVVVSIICWARSFSLHFLKMSQLRQDMDASMARVAAREQAVDKIMDGWAERLRKQLEEAEEKAKYWRERLRRDAAWWEAEAAWWQFTHDWAEWHRENAVKECKGWESWWMHEVAKGRTNRAGNGKAKRVRPAKKQWRPKQQQLQQ